MLEFPVPVKDLEGYLPHRPPMVWVHDVMAADALEGVCRVHLSRQANYMDREGVRVSSAIEWMAQAYAFTRVCHQLNEVTDQKKKLQKAYLVGIRQFELSEIRFPVQGFLTVRVKTVRELEGLTLLSGRVETEKGQLLASGTLKVFAEY